MTQWLRGLAALAVLAGCAHIEAPPGGPEDKQGPQLLTTRPDSMARLESFAGPVTLVFDEGLSEERVEEAVEVSPRTSAVAVEKRGDELRIDLRRGWERGRIYQVTVDPIIRDRFGNTIPAPVRLVFSTGPEIRETRLTGRVVERQTAAPAARTRVEAILAPDSLVYATRTDSAGGFVFRQIPEGRYQVRAFSDPNGTRSMEPFESRDTAAVEVAATAPTTVALSIIVPDSTAPQLTSASGDARTIALKFDDYLDPAQPMGSVQVRVFRPDSSEIAVAEIRVGELAAPDSLRADSAAADSAVAQPADRARVDSAAARAPVPSQALSIRLASPLMPDATHRVTVTGVRNLVGLTGGGTVQFRAPRAAPMAPARPDSAAAEESPVRPAPPPEPARPPR